jgi:ER-bound oxygenase mpaB/B'/Rubber oxygenase, catalytic domain
VPFWVDWPVVDRGGTVLLRAGPLGGLVLGLKSLVMAYTSPAGNKPLVFSGRLKEDAPRRLAETARFVRETILPGNMRPRAPGWQSTLRVRLIHAQVRSMILRTGRWDEGAWGAPINQHDEAGTSLLFSAAVLEGLRQLGVRIAPDEAEAYMHLWRWSGWLMGIDPELLVATEGEAARLGDLIKATQAAPDADSRALTRALLESPLDGAGDARQRRRAERAVRFSGALCRILIGDDTADSLGVPALSWHYKSSVGGVVNIARRVVSSVGRVRESVPFADASALRTGQRYWDRIAVVGLAGASAEPEFPARAGA